MVKLMPHRNLDAVYDYPVNSYFSNIDLSENHVFSSRSGGFFETRVVVRDETKGVVYVSSQDGCSMGCRMCHLTQSHQKFFRNASLEEIYSQIDYGLMRLKKKFLLFNRVHLNFMARGEPLDNKRISTHIGNIEDYFQSRLIDMDFEGNSRILISSIFPSKHDIKELDYFKNSKISIFYYSLYSFDKNFRRRWLPNAREPSEVFSFLREFYFATGRRSRIHHCFIENQNDSLAHVSEIVDRLNDLDFPIDINIVRYNAHISSNTSETSLERIYELVEFMTKNYRNGALKIINRIGFDVKASCGMFLEK